MRHRFVTDLAKELLGPRNGATEQFPISDDPKSEYTAGQLFPPDAPVERNPDEEDAVGAGAETGEEDSGESTLNLVNSAFVESGQNFRKVPSSMGLSFLLVSPPNDGDFSVCVTWGRYRFTEGQGWERVPNIFFDDFTNNKVGFDVQPNDRSLRLAYKLFPLSDGRCKVSVYLTSSVISGDGRGVKPDEIIFQPEIRIRLRDRNSIREVGDMGFTTDDPEWLISTRQYSRLRVFARGHLCGAYWREIDPQVTPPAGVQTPQQLPWIWIDGLHFRDSEPRITPFFDPDLRTEFVPMYSAPAPRIQAPGTQINLSAERMAECQTVDELVAIINPLMENYGDWVDALVPDTSANSPDGEIINRHRVALERMENGLNFLRRNENAFHSFLFMNKAMALQFSWGRPDGAPPMTWHPFQIAFVLIAMESTVERTPEREICDTIWFPTGGGKTEAYLGLAAFAMAYRRRTSDSDIEGSKGGEGTCVISRYTLRLLTINQFRRALKMISACEVLRCINDGSLGWKPTAMPHEDGMMWGRTPFSLGLWVGGAVTPNAMSGQGFRDIAPPGANYVLQRPAREESDPAQVLECPCCSTMLSVPVDGLQRGRTALHFVVESDPRRDAATISALSTAKIRVVSANFTPHRSQQCGYFRLEVDVLQPMTPTDLETWWQNRVLSSTGARLVSFNAARPGYFPLLGGRKGNVSGYEIRCPNSACQLNRYEYRVKTPNTGGDWDYSVSHDLFADPDDADISLGIVINAITVDERLYQTPPSMLISTCDKVAGAAFTNEAAALFGRVRTYWIGKGYSQEGPNRNRVPVENLLPPSLIIQDELHLLEGPLGSNFGLYETIIEHLCEQPKYIASSATIRNSTEQISCLMGRASSVFPPVGTDITNGFFLRATEAHPLHEHPPGRLFLGLAFPGRAPQTPMVRVWGRLLQTAQDLRNEGASIDDLDYFWTLVGYFNAIRELAQGETLVRQDIPQYLDKVRRQNPTSSKRDMPHDGFRNLSSQTGSSQLPGILSTMARGLRQGDPLTAVATTSMFGTGVDVTRLSLMIVHGQPKSASQNIQAVGRIGRERGGLAVMLYRVSKPRDLNHYEFFTGYHRRLPVSVEPITVKPLAPKALDRALGGLIAMLVRNWRQQTPSLPAGIDESDGATLFAQVDPAVIQQIVNVFQEKWREQPPERQPDQASFLHHVRSDLELWADHARRQAAAGQPLPYTGNGLILLGNNGNPGVYENVPTSLREVESTFNFYSGD